MDLEEGPYLTSFPSSISLLTGPNRTANNSFLCIYCFSLATLEQFKNPTKVATADKASQTSLEAIDASIQTDDIFITAADYNRILNNMADMNSQQELLNHYAALASGEYNLKLNEVHSGALSSAQVTASYGTQQVDPYTAAQMWSNLSQYPEYAANVYGAFLQTPAASVPANIVSDGAGNQAVFDHNVGGVNHVTTAPSHAPTQEVVHQQRVAASIPEHKDIVDEREDLAIEQSLKDFENMELESQHSYASALNTAGESCSFKAIFGMRELRLPCGAEIPKFLPLKVAGHSKKRFFFFCQCE